MIRAIRPLLALAALFAGVLSAYSQSITTGSLKLRNAQPETVSLTIPTAGVTGYTMLLPETMGSAGQALTVQSTSGTTATLGWTNTQFWELTGSSITAAGTAAGQQYLGTSNAQDLVIAANAVESIRILSTAGPSQGFVGIGTSTPRAGLEIARNVLVSNTGSASELRIAEPLADGSNYSGFKTGAQSENIIYTFPTVPPVENGVVLKSNSAGELSWGSVLSDIPRGIFTPVIGQHVQVIPVGKDIIGPVIPIVTMINQAGTTISISVTAIDTAADTFTVETSLPLGGADRIAWMILPQL